MADISLSSNTRAALNASEGVSVTALKIAAQSEQAIVALVEQVAETAKAAAPQKWPERLRASGGLAFCINTVRPSRRRSAATFTLAA
jgi:hypothetical protein